MSRTTNILANYNIRAKKRLGQNFLNDGNSLHLIADTARITKDDCVLEIGSGIGNLSVLLAPKAGHFYTIEKDHALLPILKEALASFNNTQIIRGDILDINLNDISQGKKLKVIGNLPFYITSGILIHLINQKEFIDSILITIQKEVAERITACPGTKNFGRLSCLLQFHTKPQIIEIFPKNLFSPQPKVDSALIHLSILKKPSIAVKSQETFFNVVKAIFSQRRKTLINSFLGSNILNLKKEELLDILKTLKINPLTRAEQLSLTQIGEIADKIYVATGCKPQAAGFKL